MISNGDSLYSMNKLYLSSVDTSAPDAFFRGPMMQNVHPVNKVIPRSQTDAE